MVDPERMRAKLGLLRGYREELGRFMQLPRQRFQDEPAYGYALERLVQLAGQACIDLASHVIAANGWGVPGEFRETFTVLAKHQVITNELAEHLRELTGLRNRLVHAYDEVDDERLLDSLPEGLDDLDAFARAVAALLTRDDGGA